MGISTLGRTDLYFIEPGVKINGQYYRDVLSLQKLLPDIRQQSSNDFIIFQQDSAAAHRARETVTLLDEETPDFIPSSLWPANSPDLNPEDYSIWSVLQERVYRSRIAGVEELKQRLVIEWANLDHRIISEAVGQWRARLSACVRANGRQFSIHLNSIVSF